MFNLLSKARKDKSGFSLVELLVVLLIMSVLAGIAVPLYLNQKQRSYMSIAQSDTTAVGQEVSSITLGYTSFGSSPGTIGLSSGAISFSPMTAATGVGLYSATGPGTTTSIPRLSAGSSVSGSYGAGTGTTWCLIIVNNGAYSQYTNAGLVTSGVGGTLPTCVGGVALAAPAGAYTFAFASTSPGSSPNWTNIASSSDGVKLAVVANNRNVWTSINSGSTWTNQTGSGVRNWGYIASSLDGTKLIAAVQYSGDLFTSSDSGVTWTDRASAGTRGWYGVASSSDGTKLVAVAFGAGIWNSSDSGATWTQTSALGLAWGGVAMSSDGTRQVAIAPGNYPYTSANSGATWTIQNSTALANKNWFGITSSSDGSHLAAIIGNCSNTTPTGDIWTSADYGVTWTDQIASGTRNWCSITSSSDGSHLAAGLSVPGDIYTSGDSGATWTDQTTAGSLYWYGLASSSDGKKIVGANWGGTVVTGIGS